MEIYCTGCGKVLPRDNARFCNNCGMLIPSLPSTPSTLSISESTSSLHDQARRESDRTVLREQIAYQPPSSPVRGIGQDKQFSGKDRQNRAAFKAGKVGQPEKIPDAMATDQPGNELEMTDIDQPGSVAEAEAMVQSDVHQSESEEAPQAAIANVLADGVGKENVDLPRAVSKVEESPSEEVSSNEELPTSPMGVQLADQAPVEEQNVENLPTSSLVIEPSEQPVVADAGSDEIQYQDTARLPLPSIPAIITSVPRILMPPVQRARRSFPAVIVIASLAVLLLGGLGAWVMIFQPFSVSPVTDPTQSFKSINLRVSLLYPTGWIVQVEKSKSTVRFSDSSQTAQVVLVTAGATNNDLSRYLQQQATQMGITGAKQGTQVSFAGALWQQIQGTVQKSGANYTTTIFVTVHDHRLFTLMQQAHQSIYAQEEELIFLPMRSSLQFM